MTIENWNLPLFKKAGFQPASNCTAARTDIKCTCCQTCNYPRGLKPIDSEPPFLDMYVCDVCQLQVGRELKPGPALPVLASAIKTNLTDKLFLVTKSLTCGIEKSCLNSGPSANQCNILPETLQVCPQTKVTTAIRNKKGLRPRSTKPDSKPPRKRKCSRHRTSITPVHPTHNLLLDTSQSNLPPPSPDVNPEARDAFNIPLGDAPNIRAHLPGLQTGLPKGGPPSKRTCPTKRHNSRSMPKQCSQGISGSSVNHNNADCICTEPDLYYTAATSQK
eukprot:1147031-Pelagomonas_calceolata.AAC.1